MYLRNYSKNSVISVIKRLVWLFCTATLPLLSGCTSAGIDAQNAKEGVIDLKGWNYEQDCVRLDGDWEFYWNRFIDPAGETPLSPDAYIRVPSVWNDTNVDGAQIPGAGFASYRVLVKTGLPEGTQLGLRLFTFSSAYKLFTNEELIAQNGVPANTRNEERGEYLPQAVYFRTPDESFTITIHVSNHVYARGGFWYSAFLGGSQQIAAMHDGIMQREAFLFGALVIVMLFFFALYLMRRELRYLLVFSCLCVIMLIAASMVGQLSIMRVIPMSFDTMVLVWYSSDAWLFFFLFMFIHMLFKSKLSRMLLWIFLSVTLIQQLVYLFTPAYFYTEYFAVPASVLNIVIVAGAVFVIILGIKNKREGGWLNLCGIVVAALTYVHDDMFWMNIINPIYGELHHFGLLFFLLMQMIVQAQRIRRYFNETMAAELAFRQAQIKPHFLYNTLNTIVAASHYDTAKVRGLLVSFSNYLRRSFDFSPGHMVALEKEVELAKAYIDIEKARFEERLDVQFDIEANMSSSVPVLVLQPVIENAIHHGVLPMVGAGNVKVRIREEFNRIVFSVSDDGAGMDEQKINSVLSDTEPCGVAILNIHKRLQRLYKTGLSITSNKGAGTEVSWSIPLPGKRKRNAESRSD